VLHDMPTGPVVKKNSLEERAQPLGDLNFQRACICRDERWLWDLRPSNLMRVNETHEN